MTPHQASYNIYSYSTIVQSEHFTHWIDVFSSSKST